MSTNKDKDPYNVKTPNRGSIFINDQRLSLENSESSFKLKKFKSVLLTGEAGTSFPNINMGNRFKDRIVIRNWR